MRTETGFTHDIFAAFMPIEVKSARRGGIGALALRERQPAMQLLDAVLRLAGPHAELISHAERPWASATFTGSRHTVLLGFDGKAAMAAGEAFIAALPEHEFTIRRQLVADAAIMQVDQSFAPAARLEVEAELLLLDDC